LNSSGEAGTTGDFDEAVEEGEADGIWGGDVGVGAPLAAAGAERGSCGPSR